MGRSCPAHDTPQFDCSDCRRTARIRHTAEDGRIELASTVLVDRLESDVELVLKALGHPEALVTDLSTVGDFGLDENECAAASAALGVTLSDDDYIYEIAQRLRDEMSLRSVYGTRFHFQVEPSSTYRRLELSGVIIPSPEEAHYASLCVVDCHGFIPPESHKLRVI